MGIFQKMKATKFVLETVPTVPEPWNLILFICSFFLPGVTTIVGAIIGKSDWKAFLVGVVQLILTPFLLGYIWAILWGYFMFDKKSLKKVVKKGVQVVAK